MTPFTYRRPGSAAEAVALLDSEPAAMPLAGGTGLIDLMKQGVERPQTLIDLDFAPDLKGVATLGDGTLAVGGATTLTAAARDPAVAAGWPLLHEAILVGLTPQLRNAATFGGNLMQRPRCFFFREPGFACDKRRPGSGCAARAGVHFAHAIFGAEEGRCIAVHPSDLCVALTALGAAVSIAGPRGVRRVPIDELHRLPGDRPDRETTLATGELVTGVEVPAQGARGGAYAKAPEEGFALASCAALVAVEGGLVASASVVLGGVAHRPWRSCPAEAALLGRAPDAAAVAVAAEAAAAGAETDEQTAFRAPLLRAVVAEALEAAFARAGCLA